MCVKIAVAYKNILCVVLIIHISIIMAEIFRGRIVIVVLCPRVCKPSGWVSPSCQYISRHIAPDISKLPHKDDRIKALYLFNSRTIDHSSYIQEQNCLFIVFCQKLKVFNLPVCQEIIAFPVLSVLPFPGIP